MVLAAISIDVYADQEKPTQSPKPASAVERKQETRLAALAERAAGTARPGSPDFEMIREQMRATMQAQAEYTRFRLEMMSDPEVARMLARFSRAYFEALIEVGFSEEQALQLVVSGGLPLETR